MYKDLNKTSNFNKGFTLIEMMVSLAIFTVVALVSVGAFLKVLDANKKSVNLKTTINNLNFALESISREMRVGKDYYYIYSSSALPGTVAYNFNSKLDDSGLSPENNHWLIAFRSSKNSRVHGNSIGAVCNLIYAYRYDKVNKKIQKAQQDRDCDYSLTDSDFRDLTATEIKITNSRVRVSTIPNKQPYAFFFIEGESGAKESEKVNFSMQTSVSQRIK
jgi:prepilin-type N-terminal cleavage/methylation domain-containing protein